MFLNCSTCFGRHTAHHQELKNCNCSLWFYIRLWLPVAAAIGQPSQRHPATINVCKTRECNYTFELLMMGGVSPEKCRAIKKHWNNKFYYTIASCWFFLWDLYYDARIHEHQILQKVVFKRLVKEFYLNFMNPKCSIHFHKTRPLGPVCSQSTSVHIVTSYCFKAN